jgi:excisionase family DNA binding protein
MTDRITVSVKEFCVLSGLCRDKVFAMIKSGELDSFKCGKLRLISVESYRRWVAEQISLDKSRSVAMRRTLKYGMRDG